MEWVGGDDAVVVNTDVLTNLELSAPFSLHKSSGAKLTIVAYRLRQQMRFGALHVEGERLAAWREKPVSEYVTAAGIYIISGVKLGEEYLDMRSKIIRSTSSHLLFLNPLSTPRRCILNSNRIRPLLSLLYLVI